MRRSELHPIILRCISGPIDIQRTSPVVDDSNRVSIRTTAVDLTEGTQIHLGTHTVRSKLPYNSAVESVEAEGLRHAIKIAEELGKWYPVTIEGKDLSEVKKRAIEHIHRTR